MAADEEVYQDIDLLDLRFEKRPGLRVVIEGLTTGELLDFMELFGKAPDLAKAKESALDPESRKLVRKMMEVIASSLVEWNIADRHGKVRPATLEGLMACKLGLVLDIANAWISALTDVDDDLGKDSPSTGTSDLERSIPMAPRSPSRGS